MKSSPANYFEPNISNNKLPPGNDLRSISLVSLLHWARS